MAVRNFSSTAAQTTLSSSVSPSATTITVTATTGFPSVPFVLAVDAGAAGQELVLVTNVAATTLTVTRGYDSTVAVAHDTGAVVAHSHAGIDFREANAHVNATSGVHGVTGALVGADATQTLTNKTVALGSNSISGTKAQFNSALTDADFATLDGTETLTNKTLTSPTLTGGTQTSPTVNTPTVSSPTINGAVGGTTFGAWTTYTPTFTGFSSTAWHASYKQVGKTVTVYFNAVLTSASGVLALTLPVPAVRTPNGIGVIGTVGADDAGSAFYAGTVMLSGTTAVRFSHNGSSLLWSNAVPFSWASGDAISFTATYEAA